MTSGAVRASGPPSGGGPEADQRSAPHDASIAWPIILSIAAVKLVVHLYASGFHHYFRDELYYIACGRHLDWGYVDHSPLIGIYARIGEWLSQWFGLRGFRFLGTVAGVARIVLTGVIAARLGGTRLAQGLACTAVLFSSMYLAIDTILSMNNFEHLFWLACLLVLIEIARGGSEKLWLLFGVLAGLGLQNKHSMAFLGFGVAVAVILTPLRRSFLRPWIYLGGILAGLIFLPNILWQWQHNFPTLELLRNVKETGKNVVLEPLPFLGQQLMMLNPLVSWIAVVGLVWLFFQPRFRFLAWTYVIVLITFIRLEAKDYYVAPIYPMLFAAGAVWMARRKWTAIPAFAIIIIGGLISAPLVLPVISPETYVAYQNALGIEQQKAEVSHSGELPQLFSDQFGWEEMVQNVARYYHSLPPDVRAKTAIFGGNYGEAAAIDFYGPKYGLPKAISGHQSYYLWGPRDYTGESMIVIVNRIVRTRPLYASIETAGQRYHRWAEPEENGPFFHVRTKRPPLHLYLRRSSYHHGGGGCTCRGRRVPPRRKISTIPATKPPMCAK